MSEDQSTAAPKELNSLDALAREVAAVDEVTQTAAAPEGAAPAPEVTAAPAMPPEQEARKMVELLAWGVESLFTMVGYTDETKEKAAAKLAPLLVKYNVQDTLAAKWGAEVEAGIFFASLTIGTVQIVRAHKAQDEAAQAEQKKAWWAGLFKWSK